MHPSSTAPRTQIVSLTGGFVLLILLVTFLPLDLTLSALCYDAQRTPAWFLKDALPWAWLYAYGEFPAYGMAIGALLMLLGSWPYTPWRPYRRHCLLLLLAVALGPGLVVNGLLKPLWGRPRPRHIEQFAGLKPYQPWWQPGGPGAGESFPSGHAAMGYILVAGAVLVPGGRWVWCRPVVLGGGLVYGTLMGVARVVQGGHFASDVAWSGFLMCLTIMGLQAALGVYPPPLELGPGGHATPRAP